MSLRGGGADYPGPSTPPALQQPSGHLSAPYQSTICAHQPSAHPPSSSVLYALPASSPWGQHNLSYPSAPAHTPGYGGYLPYGHTSHAASRMPSSFQPGTDPETVRAFEAADRDWSDQINEQERQQILSTTHPPEDSRKIGLKEFPALWKALKNWKRVFERFDKDLSGSSDKGTMREALLSLCYAISLQVLDFLLPKYERPGLAKAVDYDSSVKFGLIVKGLTEKLKEKDTQLRGSATLDLLNF